MLREYKTNLGQSPRLRIETLDGQEHYVYPLVLAREIVMNGLFYSKEELERSVQLWNDVPVPVYHPNDHGQDISARDPKVLNESVIGRVYAAHMDGDKLKAEFWLNVEKADELVPGLRERIELGEDVDVSTALFSDDLQEQGSYGGRQYRAVVTNIRPDHLAILPDVAGACSFQSVP